jgi:UDP-N-acetylglucosamine:LPS N-acetylglucosamine transferase
MKIVLTGGGTAGHVVPLLAMLPELRNYFSEVVFFGGGGIERELAKKAGCFFVETPVVAFSRTKPLKNLAIPKKLATAVRSAKASLIKIKPDVVLSKGGYSSLPTVIAARKLGIPVAAHESDFSLGLANRVAKLYGAVILTSHRNTVCRGGVYSGFPLRKALKNGNAENARRSLDLYGNGKVLLVMGGSQGSAAINKTLLCALPELLSEFSVVHVTGRNKQMDFSAKNYRQLEYTDKIADLYALADVVISRAGAGAVSELSYLEKSVVLIPLPKGNSRGDQVENAAIAKEYGAVVLSERCLNADTLVEAVRQAEDKNMRALSYPANDFISGFLYRMVINSK